MKSLIAIFLLFLTSGLLGQNSSFGIGVGAVNLENTGGLQFTGNVRAQFSKTLGWQTEVSYISLNETFTTIEEIETPIFGGTQMTTLIEETGSSAMTIKTGATVKFFEYGGLRAEAIVGGGLFKNNKDLFGLLSGELFLSVQIGKNLVAGIPLSYNFITWERDEYYSGGISFRFHM